MKPIYKEFWCPKFGEVRYINVNGICFDCNNQNILYSLGKKRKSHSKLSNLYQSLNVENFS